MTPFRTVGYGRQGYVLLPQPTMDLTGALKFVELIEHQLDGLLHAPIWFLLDSVFVCNFAVAHSNGHEQLAALCLELPRAIWLLRGTRPGGGESRQECSLRPLR